MFILRGMLRKFGVYDSEPSCPERTHPYPLADMNLLVGLGNPGRAYARSRHNVGFQCLDSFAAAHGISMTRRAGQAQVGRGRVAGQDVVLAKPLTFMNLSGLAVRSLMQQFHVPLPNLLVVYDDLDLPLGKLRFREKGSAGGHRGVKSIIDEMGNQDFPRLRVGIGPLPPEFLPNLPKEERTARFVLGGFPLEEQAAMKEVYSQAAEALHAFLAEGIEAAMNKYN